MSKDLKITSGDSGGYSPGAYAGEMKLARVNLEDREDVKKWAGVLGISEAEVHSAAERFGTLVRNIRAGLLAEKDAA